MSTEVELTTGVNGESGRREKTFSSVSVWNKLPSLKLKTDILTPKNKKESDISFVKSSSLKISGKSTGKVNSVEESKSGRRKPEYL